ncbi:MAG: GHKL domain-containing protein [Bacteroidales bacterium]|nr:GHKL domain-containing protein [Bacteroidales bacterium]
MMRMTGNILLIFTALTNIIQPARSGDFKMDYLTTKQGLSESVVTCIFKDSRGFVWFGTQNGLNRFDGYEFTCYYHSDSVAGSISGNYIRSVAEDSGGNLWVGTDKNGLNKYCRSADTFTVFRHSEGDQSSISDNTVLSIVNYGQDSLLIGTGAGLCFFDPVKEIFSEVRIKTGDEIAGSLYVESILAEGRTVWLGTERGLFRLNLTDGKAVRYVSDPLKDNTLSNNMVHCIFRTSKGNLLAGTNEGLNVLSDDGRTFARYYYGPGLEGDMRKSEIQAITEDHLGNIWVGSFGGGVIRADPVSGKSEIITSLDSHAYPLNNDYIYSLYYDPSGLLWIGTYGGGVNKLGILTVSFGHFSRGSDPERSLVSNEVYAIHAGKEELWVGTDNGLSIRNMKSGSFQHIPYRPGSPGGLSSSRVYALLEDSAGNMWIGTADNGLSMLSFSDRQAGRFRFRKIAHDPGNPGSLSSNSILCLSRDGQGKIWVGTEEGLNVLDNQGNIIHTYFHHPDDPLSLSSDFVNVVYCSEDGTVWIGTSDGLNRFSRENNAFARVRIPGLDEEDGSSHAVYCITGDENGFLWIGTDNAGLFRYDAIHGHCQQFMVEQGLPDNVVYALLPDPDGSFWISTNNGLARIRAGGEADRLTVVKYNTSGGLPVDSYNIGAYAKGADGKLYFGSYKGLVYFHPDEVRGNAAIPPVYITGFSLFFEPVPISSDGSTPLDRHITETGQIILNHRQNVVQFKFSALDYTEPSKNNYAFMMEGLEREWNYVKNRREAQYLYLPPGEYTFRVIASGSNGVWNRQGASLSVIVRPPFTATIWFYLGVALAVILIVLLILHIRTRRLRAIKVNLENQVERRTSELKETNEELNKALDDLRRTQTQLVNAEKMASLGQLTAGVAHEINNPINFVSGNVKPLKRDIGDIINILRAYEEAVEKNKLQDIFKDVAHLKKSVDYHLLTDEIYQLLSGIGEGADRTAEIVRGLRNFSRLDEEELKKADINEGLNATLLILTHKLKNDIEVVRDFGSIPPVMCYPGQLNQVFLNILNNAAEAIRGKGTITINTRQEGGRVVISVKDTGAGMTEAVLKRIFEPFYTTKDVGKGTGLGLSISYGIIKKHNGTIEVKSIPGKGSEFIIALPANITNKD